MTDAESDLELFRSCFERNGSPRDLARVRWQYSKNPTGRIWVDFAIDDSADGRVAGIYAVLPVWLKVRGVRLLAAQSVDTLTDEAYRGQGLFVKLARSVYQRAVADRASLVFGFPNGNSAHGFFTKLDWQPLDPVPFLVRPLRTKYLTSKLLARASTFVPDVRLPVLPVRLRNGERIERVERFDETCDDVWWRFSRNVGFAVDREARYLNWRFREKPGVSYDVLALRRNDGEIAGFIVYTVYEKHGGCIGYIMELLHDPERVEDARKLLNAALKDIADRGADAVLAWCFGHSPNHRAFVTSGFLPLPERFRPIELHVGARSFDLPPGADPGDRRQWYMSYADSDTV